MDKKIIYCAISCEIKSSSLSQAPEMHSFQSYNWSTGTNGAKAFKDEFLFEPTFKMDFMLKLPISDITRYVSRVVKYNKKSFHHLTMFFSCLLDEMIAKICKKLKSHGGFLSYLQDRTTNPANMAAIFCPALVCPQKAIVGIKFLAYFLQSPCQ